MKKCILGLLLAGCLLGTWAWADGEGEEEYSEGCGNHPTPPCNCPQNTNGGPSPDNETVGPNSVLPYRANKSLSVTDLETGGVAPVAFTRIYNSRTTDFTTNYVEFGWRQTWQHNWAWEMRDLSSYTEGVRDIKLRYPDGHDYTFKAADSNGAVRVAYSFAGDRLYPWSGDTVGFTLVRVGGEELDFQRSTYPRYRLVRKRDGQGHEWTMDYDAHGRISRITNPFGRWLEIQRGLVFGELCITNVAASDGRSVAYSYGTWNSTPDPLILNPTVNNVLTGAAYPGGEQAVYTYVGAESLISGRPLLSTAVNPVSGGPGAKTKLTYNYDFKLNFGSGPYLVTGVVLQQQNLATGEALVSLPLGSGDYPQVLLQDGVEETFKYSDGLVRERRDGEGRKRVFTRDQNDMGYVTGVTDSQSNTWSYVRDYAGRVLSKADPLGNTNSYTYNAEGFTLTETDPLGNITTCQRDANNLPTNIVYPDGSFETFAYNEWALPVTNRLRNGGFVTFEYYGTNELGGSFGDLKSVTDPLGNATTYTWDAAGHPLSVTDANFNTTQFAFNWRGLLLAVTNADGTFRSYQYDDFGNCTNAVDELGRAVVLEYDDYNRVVEILDPLARRTSIRYGRMAGCGGCGVYEPLVAAVTNAAGQVTHYAYDNTGKRTAEVLAVGTPDESVTVWTYDSLGRLATQRDAMGNVHRWAYDAAGRLAAETNAWGAATHYAYDSAGHLTNRIDGAGVSVFAKYDAMGRRTAVGSGGTRYETAYDAVGRATSVCTRVSGNVTRSTTFAYDLAGRLTAKTDSSGYALSYGYDAVGARTNLTVPGVLSVGYSYDEMKRLTEILGNGNAIRFAYDAAGQRTNALWPNGTGATYSYDAAGQLLSLVHQTATGTPIASFEYAYDAAGNRTNMTTLEGLHSFAYDNRNQLVGALYPDGSSETFSYDLVGNRTSLVAVSAGNGTNTTAYHYESGNRLSWDASETATNQYAYDGAGRLTNHVVNGQTRTFAYNFQGRMTSLTDIDGSVFAYEFDGEGNRLSQSLNDCLSKRFVYDGADVLLELNPTNGVAYAWVNGPGIDQPIERLLFIDGEPRARRVFHSDALGSIAALTAPDGLLTDTYAYTAFGTLRSRTGADLNRVTYTAREQLGDSQGWMYYRNRIYDFSTGRFISEDPLAFSAGVNQWTYVLNNALGFRDVLGLAPVHNNSSYTFFYKPEKDDDFRNALWVLKGEEFQVFPNLGVLLPGQTANVDGLYTPWQTVIKVPNLVSIEIEDCCFKVQTWHGGRSYLWLGNLIASLPIRVIREMNTPRLLLPEDFNAQNMRNWANPYTGYRWPYPKWDKPSP